MKHQAFNPYLPGWEYVPDGEPYVFDDRIYVYGSHDRFNGEQFCELNYVCWSAPVTDLGYWRFEGEIYDKHCDPLCTGDDRLLFAPDVAKGPDGRYYLYYAFDFAGVISVAVCDTPAGRYEFYGHVKYPDGQLLGQRQGDSFQFDPGLLVDDDGRIYLYTGFCMKDSPFPKAEHLCEDRGAMVVELEPDMLTVKTEPRFIAPCHANSEGTGFEGHEFFEASSMRKIGGRYYFIYSSINSHELCYAVGDGPTGRFAYGGTLVSNGDIYLNGTGEEEAVNYTGNNHGSLVEIGDKLYIFYHRQTNRNQFSRQGCAERVALLPDGSIPQVEITSCGLNDGPLEGRGEYEARIACNLMSGLGTVRYEFGRVVGPEHPYFTQEDAPDGKPVQYIANLTNDAKAAFKYFAFSGLRSISVWLRGSGEGQLTAATGIDGAAAAQIPVRPASNWTKCTAPVSVPDGIAQLSFVFHGTGAVDFLKFELE